MAAVGLRAWQGRGVGRALLEATISACPHERVSLFVHRDNAAALGFYAHLGFVPTGRRVDDGPMHAMELLRAGAGQTLKSR